jgi:hypothetical protein
MRKRSISWNFPKLCQLWWSNRGFGPSTTQNQLWPKQFVSGTRNSSRVAACALWNEQGSWSHRLRLSSVCNQYPFAQRHLCRICQTLDWGICNSWLVHCVDFWGLLSKVSHTHHVSSRLPSSSETCKYTIVPITQINLERFSTYWYVPFCCVSLGYCAAEFRSSRQTYELSYI